MRFLAGNSDFKSVRQQGHYYVDKSLLVADVLNADAQVMLITRPRRFGKTLNLSMLEAFFQRESDNRALFQGLAIENDEDAMTHQGAYPTIFLTFKDFNSPKWEDCEFKIRTLFSALFLKHKAWIDQAKPQYAELSNVEQILNQSGPLTLYQGSLKLLTDLLQRATGSPVVILIDEYDTPINAGQLHGFFDPVVDFMRNLLGAALKDNTSLERGVLTGILRVAKESIFSGLNNIRSYSLLSEPFSNRFGFTSTEMEQVLTDFGLIDRKDEARTWYNGYNIGRHMIYNPWSIINLVTSQGKFESYWVNTSSNDLIKQLLLRDRSLAGDDLALLLQGQPIRRKISESITLRDIQPKDVWSLMFYSGYLTTGEPSSAVEGIFELKIPNLEVRNFFEDTVRGWLGPPEHWYGILDALLREDMAAFEQHLSRYVLKSVSYHDLSGPTGRKRKGQTVLPEALYHMLFLGMVMSTQAYYEISSNRESGEGRYDLVLLPKQPQKAGYIFEFKQTKSTNLKSAADHALQQIQERQYATSLVFHRGMKSLILVGVAFSGKRLAMVHHFQTLTIGRLSTPPQLDVREEPVVTLSHKPNFDQTEENAVRSLVRDKIEKILATAVMAPMLQPLFLISGGESRAHITPSVVSKLLLEKGVIKIIGILARSLLEEGPTTPKLAWEKALEMIGWLVHLSLKHPLPRVENNFINLPVQTLMGAEIALAHYDRRPAKFSEIELKGFSALAPTEGAPTADALLKTLAEELLSLMGLSWSFSDEGSSGVYNLINGALSFQNATGESTYFVLSTENLASAEVREALRSHFPELKVVILQQSLEPEHMLIPDEYQLAGALSMFLNQKKRWLSDATASS